MKFLLNSRMFAGMPVCKKYAFTLAEVLITLGVIGVVAAITMPTLIKKYQQQVTVTQLKKAYSEFTQALQKAELEHGLRETWNFADFETAGGRVTYFGDNYLFPHLKIVEKCVPSTNKCWADNILNVSGNTMTDGYLSNSVSRVSAITASGYSLFYWLDGTGNGMWYWVDINGPKKGPNKLGRDIFTFKVWWGVIPGSGQVSPYSSYSREDLKASCKKGTSKSYSDGRYCGALIMHDGWKISDDYPW